MEYEALRRYENRERDYLPTRVLFSGLTWTIPHPWHFGYDNFITPLKQDDAMYEFLKNRTGTAGIKRQPGGRFCRLQTEEKLKDALVFR